MYVSRKPSSPDQLFSRRDCEKNQRELDLARNGLASISCLCRGWPGAPLHVRQGKTELHPVKAGGTAHLHANGCPHSAVANLSAAYGAPAGAMSEQDDGRVLVSFGRLFSDSDPEGGGGGQWETPCHGPRLLSLAWLLIMQSDLNVSHPRSPVQNPFNALRYGARNIDVRRKQTSDLDSLLILPATTNPEQVKRNRGKLRQAVGTKSPVLVAAMLPPLTTTVNGEPFIDLKPTLGVPIKIYSSVLQRAFNRFTHATSRWRAGGDVLMLALASVKSFKSDDGKDWPYATVHQLALLSVAQCLTPLPTPILEKLFVVRQVAGEGFAVGPEDDGLLRQWAGGAKQLTVA